MNLQTSGECRRENAEVCLPVMPAQAGIQYSETLAMESRTRGVLDTRFRGYDGGGSSVVAVIARSICDEAIQLFLFALDCFACARNNDVETLTGKMAQSGIFAAIR